MYLLFLYTWGEAESITFGRKIVASGHIYAQYCYYLCLFLPLFILFIADDQRASGSDFHILPWICHHSNYPFIHSFQGCHQGDAVSCNECQSRPQIHCICFLTKVRETGSHIHNTVFFFIYVFHFIKQRTTK